MPDLSGMEICLAKEHVMHIFMSCSSNVSNEMSHAGVYFKAYKVDLHFLKLNN